MRRFLGSQQHYVLMDSRILLESDDDVVETELWMDDRWGERSVITESLMVSQSRWAVRCA